MRRTFINLLAAVTILFQGLASAWALPATPPMAMPEMQMSADMDGMPCDESGKTGANSCCNDQQCNCDYQCAPSGAGVITLQMRPYIPAHPVVFIALLSSSAVLPAYALHPLRPPITSIR